MRNDAMTFGQWVDVVVGCAARAANERRRRELERLERNEAAEFARDPRRAGVFAPGDVVTYAALWLQLAYASAVPEHVLAAAFTLRACDCALCELGAHVCTTDWLADYACYRHLHRDAVRHVGAVHSERLAIAPLVPMPRLGNTRYVRPGEL